MNEKALIPTISGILTILSIAFGTYFFIDAQYARCEDVKKLERRLDYKIENDKLWGMQQRVWQIEGHYAQIDKAPPDVKQRYKELQADLEMQRHKVQKMEAR